MGQAEGMARRTGWGSLVVALDVVGKVLGFFQRLDSQFDQLAIDIFG